MKRKLLFFALVFSLSKLSAQQNLGLFALNQTVDYAKVNPAYIGDFEWALSLFPLSYQLYSNGPTYNDFFVNNEGNSVSVLLRYPTDKLKTGQENLLRAGSEIETFRFIFNKDKWSFNAHHSSKSFGILDYTGRLLEVAIRGNAPFVGQNIRLDSDFEVFSYEELGLGVAIEFDKIRVGIRPKLLFGHSVVNTRNGQLSLFTDDDIFQIAVDADVAVEIAGGEGRNRSQFNFGPLELNFSDNDNVIVQSPELLFNINDDIFNFSSNLGWGFDIGFDWAINEKMNITASILDIGSIRWKENTRTFTANEVFELEGISLGQLTFDGNETFTFDNLQDSFNIIQFVETNTAFSTTLPTQFYAGFSYQLTPKWKLQSTFYHTSIKRNPLFAFATSANYQLDNRLNIGASWSIMNEDLLLLGLNATVQLGALQFYALTDNIIHVFNPQNGTSLNARIGLALLFGDKSEEAVIEEPIRN